MPDTKTAAKPAVEPQVEEAPEVSEYFNRNVNNKWEKFEVSPEEIKQIKKETNLKNVKTLLTLKKKYGKGTEFDFSENEILALFDKLSQHYRYRAESFVDKEVEERKSKSK